MVSRNWDISGGDTRGIKSWKQLVDKTVVYSSIYTSQRWVGLEPLKRRDLHIWCDPGYRQTYIPNSKCQVLVSILKGYEDSYGGRSHARVELCHWRQRYIPRLSPLKTISRNKILVDGDSLTDSHTHRAQTKVSSEGFEALGLCLIEVSDCWASDLRIREYFTGLLFSVFRKF